MTHAALRLFCDNHCNRRSAMRGGTVTGVVAGCEHSGGHVSYGPLGIGRGHPARAAAAFGARLGHTRNASINLSSDCLPDLHRDATAHAVHGSASAGLLAQA